VPVDDLGIQTLVGKVMGYERRLSAEELQAALEPFAPFRGLAVFYLLVGSRLSII
jgi:3-methyladenine DNA glycosylase/8-oxoguanine DNA glycosylase